ncbi:UDP-glucuronosyltransferase 1-1 [Homalodisca vitripennis]|nr:UDP-glucuronosyltransferase 1-1 [Homalodisca vitripennis]
MMQFIVTAMLSMPSDLFMCRVVFISHPNCVLFITHGGLFSQHEAFYAGVPVIGIPFFNEQRYNMKYYEQLGAGITLELNAITEESVHNAINTVIHDQRYKENARRTSSIVRDQPMSPADTAVYWVEYVLRHEGAPHLKPASVYLRWYEVLMLDIVLVLILSVALIIYTVYYVIKRALRFCLSNTVTVSKNKKIK